MLKNLFGFITLKGGGDTKTLGIGACAWAQVIALTLVPIASASAHARAT